MEAYLRCKSETTQTMLDKSPKTVSLFSTDTSAFLRQGIITQVPLVPEGPAKAEGQPLEGALLTCVSGGWAGSKTHLRRAWFRLYLLM